MNKILLKLALLPSGLWKSMGADPAQLQAILDVKLKLDDRKPVSIGKSKAQKKNRRFSIGIGMFVSFITGLIYVLPLILFQDTLLALSTFFTMFLFLLTFTLITDFSTVLIDTRDKYIVLPRPVGDQTLFLSRLLHVFIYLFRIVLPMSLPGWIAVGLKFGWVAVVWFPVPLLLLLCTALFLVMGAYLLILRLAPAERFKDILGYFQIAVSIVIFAFFYLAPRALNSQQFFTLKMQDFPWLQLTPPYWIAATWSWIRLGSVPAGTIYYSLLAVAVPAIALWVTLKLFAPQFTARLGGLDAVEGASIPAAASQKAVKRNRMQGRLSVWLNKREEAQAGFLLTWLQTARSRSFKMKIYPMFAYVPIYFIYLMLQSGEPLRKVWEDLPGSGRHIVLLYMCSIVVMQALSMVTTSEQYKASWVYYALPLKEPGAVMAGAFKAMWVKYFLPFFAGVSIFVLAVWGAPAITDVLLGMLNVTLYAVCMARITVRKFPFSKIDQMDSSGSRVMRVLVSMSLPVLLGFGHYAALHLLWLKMLFMALSAIMLWLVWDSYAHTQWSDMKAQED